MRRLGSTQDFAGAQLLNWRNQVLAAAPSSPNPGQQYYDSGSAATYTWNGTAWRPSDASKLTDGTIQIAALATNPLARGNHTGTQPSSTISDLATVVKGYTLDSFAAPAGPVSMASQRLTLLANASVGTDATNLNQVNGLIANAIQGINAIKAPVRIATDANITLSGLQTIQSVTLAAGDRVLVRAQTDGTKNLIYNVASGAWTMATDDDQSGELIPGTQVLANEGTYAGSVFRITTLGTITIGTTSITWTQAAQPGSYVADETTLHMAGGTFSARLAYGLTVVANGIQVLPDPAGGLQVGSAGVAAKLPTGSLLKQDTSGLYVDTTSTIAVARITGGTITGNGSATSFTFTHNLGTRRIIVQFQDSSYNVVDIDWVATDVNTITINPGSTPLANGTAIAVTVTG